MQMLADKPKIAFIFNHASFLGGGEISFFELIKCLVPNLPKPLVVVPGDGEILTRIANIGIPAEVCPFASFRNMNMISSIAAAAKLAKILKTEKVDLIHVNGSRACAYAGIVGKILGIPVIWHVRETKRDVAAYDRFLASVSTSIICVSKSVGDKRFGRLNATIRERINTVYNGIDPHKFQLNLKARETVRRQFGIGDGTLLGTVGNIIPLKGHHVFLKALAEVKKMQPGIAAKAIFIGKFLDPDYREKLLELTHKMKLQKDVVFKGPSDNIPDYLSALDIFVLPSQREGCSRALLEAMSVGLPIIASDISEIEEVAARDRNAVLVEYGDELQLAAAILKLSEDKRLREKLGGENRRRVTALFTLQSHVAGIEHVYADLIRKHDQVKFHAYRP